MSNANLPAKPGWLRGRILGAPVVSKKRKAIALAIAAIADLLQLGIWPAFVEGATSPFDDGLDAVVAIALVLTLGFSGRLLAALALELTPGAALFPAWTMVVASIPTEPDVIVATAEPPPRLPGSEG